MFAAQELSFHFASFLNGLGETIPIRQIPNGLAADALQ
jgi:hypothetical protein